MRNLLLSLYILFVACQFALAQKVTQITFEGDELINPVLAPGKANCLLPKPKWKKCDLLETLLSRKVPLRLVLGNYMKPTNKLPSFSGRPQETS